MNLAYNLIGLEQVPLVLFYSSPLIGALSGFLLFNLEVFNGRKIFPGVSGSMFVGMLMAVTLLLVSQTGDGGSGPIPAALCLWMIAIQLTDMTTIVARHVLSGRSPMSPEIAHIYTIS